MFFDAATLFARIEAVRSKLADGEKGWVEEDLRIVVLDVCTQVAPVLDVAELDRVVADEASVDVEALGAAVATLKKAPISDFEMPQPTKTTTEQRFEMLDNLVESAARADRLPAMEFALRLGLIGDNQFDSLLVALKGNEAVRLELRDAVRKKLTLLNDVQILQLLTTYEHETDTSREVHIALPDDSGSPHIFRVATADEARDRCADYIAVLRPMLERRMLGGGVVYLPPDFFGIARILSWTSGTRRTLTLDDQLAAKCVSRVAVCWGDQRADLAGALRVSVDGPLLSGRGYQAAKSALSTGRRTGSTGSPSTQTLLGELWTLVHLAQKRRATSPLENTLRWYKAGLEVTGRKLLKWMDKLTEKEHELVLQRHVCRFLVERGHHAVGTKFGSNEVDLRGEDKVGVLLVEVKRWPAGAPTESIIRGWFAQLQRYMGDEPRRSRGALLIYNFSETPILSLNGTIHEQYLFLPINLCSVGASETKGSVLVEESNDPAVFVSVRRNLVAKTRRKRTATTTQSKSARPRTTRPSAKKRRK